MPWKLDALSKLYNTAMEHGAAWFTASAALLAGLAASLLQTCHHP